MLLEKSQPNARVRIFVKLKTNNRAESFLVYGLGWGIFHSATLKLAFCVGIVLVSMFTSALNPVRSAEPAKTAVEKFDKEIAPILAKRCLSCHQGWQAKGQLDLSAKSTAMTGGESGVAIVPSKPKESLLWQRIHDDEMPPKKPLPEAERLLIQTWIADGAVWGTEKIEPFLESTSERAGRDWWSLQPLRKIEPPPFPKTKIAFGADSANPIDAFVYQRLHAAGLMPSKAADKRTLIRRLSFDLLGLPPTREQVEVFLEDESDEAYARLVDRLLASPHYGERWARHWLDLVRFGESHGFEYDQPRDNAWYYRNWVIDALNRDMPYDEFVRWQLAGDVMHRDDLNAAAAAGFLVAGAHNTTLPASTKMRMTMAQDELEDVVGVVGQTFLGLTINCARCHDHKFDPISQREYYQFAAALAGAQHGERTMKMSPLPDSQQRRAELQTRLAKLRQQLDEIENPVRAAILADRSSGKGSEPEPPAAFASWEFSSDFNSKQSDLKATAHSGAKIENGAVIVDGKESYVATDPLGKTLNEKTLEVWVQLDNLSQRGGGVMTVQTLNGVTFDSIVFGEREPKRWMAGSNHFARYQSFNAPEESEADKAVVHIAIVYGKDGSITGYRNGKQHGKTYRHAPLQVYQGGKYQMIFGMRHGPPAANKMLAGSIHKANLYDRALSADEVAASAGIADATYISDKELEDRLPSGPRITWRQLRSEMKKVKTELASQNTGATVKLYTTVSKNPGVTHLLKRGNVADPGEAVSPSGIEAVTGASADFGLEPNASDADRRQRLADWVTNRNNPLFARVMVNRIWQYHFGQGFVATSSDFGFNGGQPTHPELLDWLAIQFRNDGYSLKMLHRLIVTSATYRQASALNVVAQKKDADNRLLWRRSPQRLEAEAIRDAMLLLTDQLDPTIGGRGYRDVRQFKYKGSNFYESLPEDGEAKLRRTIYRFTARGGRNPFLDTFDCPDPSTTAPKRATTITPLQALALMNNDLVFKMADALAKRVESESAEPKEQINSVYNLAYTRDASPAEIEVGVRFISQHGLPAFCRVVFNSNEFIFVQ